MSIAFGFHPLAVALALILAGLLTWWSYRRTTPPVSTARRWTLIALRWSSLALVLLLLAEPIIRTIVNTTRRPILAVLFDTSRSLSDAVHPGKDYSESLRQSLQSVNRVAGEADIQTFRFGSDIEPWKPTSDSISFDGARTDISAALEGIRGKFSGRPLKGVVLISDGRFNTGSNPIYVAEHYPVPIHTVVVGDTTTHRDVRIERIAANEIGYVDREMPVRVTLHANGFDQRKVKVSLKGANISSTDGEAVLPSAEGEVSVDLMMTPSTEGFQRIEAAVEALDGESTTADNRMSFSVRILKQKETILLLSAGPSPDAGAIREMLTADKDLDVEAHTQKSATEWYGGPPPRSLGRYDAIILAGYPGSQADRSILETIAKAKKPLLFLLDHTTDLRLVRDKLGSVLPVSVERVRKGFVNASPVESPAGKTHPILKLPGSLNRLPPLAYSSTSWKTSPDARTLATVSIKGVSLDDPLLVVRSRSGTRSAAVLGAGIWRWRNVPDDLSDLDDLFPELVSNLLQWITTESDNRPVRVRPVTEMFDGGDNVQFTGEVYDESLDPVSDASVVLSITDPSGTTFDYRMDALGSGRYSRELGRLPEGSYRYKALASKEGVTVGADSGRFAVGQLLIEFQDSRADPAIMRQIARRSGGSFIPFGQISSLGARLSESGSLKAENIEQEAEIVPRRFLPLLFLIVALLSAEWIIRKRSGMV